MGFCAQETKREHDLLDVGGQGNEEAEGIENAKWTSIKAVLLLLLGTIIAAAFADPLVDAVDNFSEASSIPAFFISFIFLPLATNSSEAVSAIILLVVIRGKLPHQLSLRFVFWFHTLSL